MSDWTLVKVMIDGVSRYLILKESVTPGGQLTPHDPVRTKKRNVRNEYLVIFVVGGETLDRKWSR